MELIIDRWLLCILLILHVLYFCSELWLWWIQNLNLLLIIRCLSILMHILSWILLLPFKTAALNFNIGQFITALDGLILRIPHASENDFGSFFSSYCLWWLVWDLSCLGVELLDVVHFFGGAIIKMLLLLSNIVFISCYMFQYLSCGGKIS